MAKTFHERYEMCEDCAYQEGCELGHELERFRAEVFEHFIGLNKEEFLPFKDEYSI